jgi:hypothetical protein
MSSGINRPLYIIVVVDKLEIEHMTFKVFEFRIVCSQFFLQNNLALNCCSLTSSILTNKHLFYVSVLFGCICPRFETSTGTSLHPIQILIANSSFKGRLAKSAWFFLLVKPFPLHTLLFWNSKITLFKKIMRNIKRIPAPSPVLPSAHCTTMLILLRYQVLYE